MTVGYRTREQTLKCQYCEQEFQGTKQTKFCSYECRDRSKIQKDNLDWAKRKPLDERKLDPNSMMWANPYRRLNLRRRAESDLTGVLNDG